jgi:fatty acid desaturase
MKTAVRQVDSSESSRHPKTEGRRTARGKKKEVGMLETILIILVVLWALGLFAFHAGGLIHVLLVIALVVLIVRLLQGRKVL